MKKMKSGKTKYLWIGILAISTIIAGSGMIYFSLPDSHDENASSEQMTEESVSVFELEVSETVSEKEEVVLTEVVSTTEEQSADNSMELPQYAGQPSVEINDNLPDFTEEDHTTESFEDYSELDSLGRCGVAFSCIGTELMPEEERGEIGAIRPSGWHTVKYNDIIEDRYLYNRCHLIGYQLSGENSNEKNLITGTRYMNMQGMLPYENMVSEYVEHTGNHVLYRVTPIFEGNNLVASGVEMEAYSVEDKGKGVSFHVYCFNVQPGIEIDYTNGDSWIKEDYVSSSTETTEELSSGTMVPDYSSYDYVLNTNTKKFHYPWCSSVSEMKEKNRKGYTGSRDELVAEGYSPCKRCMP